MSAPIETDLAEKTVTALKELAALVGFKVYANWCDRNGRQPFDENGRNEYRVVDVNVKPRRYESFTSSVATVEILLDGRIGFSSRVIDGWPADAYLEIVGLLEEWHGSIAAAKRALGTEFFDPVGMRLDGGGDFYIDRESNAVRFSIPFTVRGRVRR